MQRRRKRIIWWVSLSTVAVAAIWFGCWEALGYATHHPLVHKATTAPPNVAVLLLDALRADRVAAQYNGIPLMPNLQAFSQKSLRFSNAISPCSWTKPSMTSLFTSLYADSHGVYYEGNGNGSDSKAYALPANLDTMATLFKKAGYTTAGVQTNWNLAEQLGFARGFDTYDFSSATARELTDLALSRLSKLASPFFLYVHYLDPHSPYTPPDTYRSLLNFPATIAPEDRPWVDDFVHTSISGQEASPAAREAVQTLYDGEVKYLDDELNRLLNYLLSKKNTIIVILADHGEQFWEHNGTNHAYTLYQEEIHVPLIIRGPGIVPMEIEDTVETIDVLPTLADLADLPQNPQWQGQSLFELTRPAYRPAFSDTRALWPMFNIHLDQVQLGDWKLIVDQSHGTSELYDLVDDPYEKYNVFDEYPEQAAELRALLDEHLQENAERAQRVGQVEQQPLPPEAREQLESIGYGR